MCIYIYICAILDIYYWGACLVMTGRLRDTGQNVLQYSFQTESSSSPSYCHIFFLIAFLNEAIIRNRIIIIYINYTLICHAININAVININYGRLQEFILLFRIPMGTRKNFVEIHRQFGHAPSNISHPCPRRTAKYHVNVSGLSDSRDLNLRRHKISATLPYIIGVGAQEFWKILVARTFT
jgi:hypothetical protein